MSSANATFSRSSSASSGFARRLAASPIKTLAAPVSFSVTRARMPAPSKSSGPHVLAGVQAFAEIGAPGPEAIGPSLDVVLPEPDLIDLERAVPAIRIEAIRERGEARRGFTGRR